MIYRVDVSDPSNSGVVKKMNGIDKALRHHGHHIDSIYQAGQDIIYGDIKHPMISSPRWLQQLRWYSYLADLLGDEPYDMQYIRYGLSTPSLLSFLKKYRKKHPHTKIIMDMPTYPYAREWSGLYGRISMMMDTYCARRLSRYVDLMTHSGRESVIHDIPTLQMSNGLDVSSVPLTGSNKTSDQLHMIAVGKWQYWHGLDRMIKGLGQSSIDAHLHIVGDGPELARLRASVSDLELDDYVTFHGSRVGTRLDRLFDQCHIAIGTLGLHRKGVAIDSSLKHREYCARGIPMVLSSNDMDFPLHLDWVHYVPVSDEHLDIAEIVQWYRSVWHDQLAPVMRDYAQKHLSWESRLRAVINASEE